MTQRTNTKFRLGCGLVPAKGQGSWNKSIYGETTTLPDGWI